MFPKDVRYTQTHEWVRLEGTIATVGITKYAAEQLSDLTYVELPDVGDELGAETALGAIESVKAAADLICPIDGKVVEVNPAVVENPEVISEDPYEDGWLVKLQATEPAQIDELMTAEAYQEFVLAEAGDEEEEEEEEEEEVEEELEVEKKPIPKKRVAGIEVDPLEEVDDDEDEDEDADADAGGDAGEEGDEEEEEDADELL